MNAILTLTPVSNVDYALNQIVDNDNQSLKTFAWIDWVYIYNTSKEEDQQIQICNISLFDHRLYIDGEQYHILHMLSK